MWFAGFILIGRAIKEKQLFRAIEIYHDEYEIWLRDQNVTQLLSEMKGETINAHYRSKSGQWVQNLFEELGACFEYVPTTFAYTDHPYRIISAEKMSGHIIVVSVSEEPEIDEEDAIRFMHLYIRDRKLVRVVEIEEEEREIEPATIDEGLLGLILNIADKIVIEKH
jgi:hypothetical protein